MSVHRVFLRTGVTVTSVGPSGRKQVKLDTPFVAPEDGTYVFTVTGDRVTVTKAGEQT